MTTMLEAEDDDGRVTCEACKGAGSCGPGWGPCDECGGVGRVDPEERGR